MGDSSSSTFFETALRSTSPRSIARSRHAGEPISHRNDSVWTSSSPGTSKVSRSWRRKCDQGPGNGAVREELEAELGLAETAKMHPSSTMRPSSTGGEPDPEPL